MCKKILYKYLGTNGTIISPIHLEDIYYIRLIELTSDDGKILTNGIEKTRYVVVSEDELNNWYEINLD
jgi:hypothetical protein